MDEGRSSQLWDHTASLMALLVNLKRTKRSQKLARASEFHPHLRQNTDLHDAGTPQGKAAFRETFKRPGVKVHRVKASEMRKAAGDHT